MSVASGRTLQLNRALSQHPENIREISSLIDHRRHDVRDLRRRGALLPAAGVRHTADRERFALHFTAVSQQRFDLGEHIKELNVEQFGVDGARLLWICLVARPSFRRVGHANAGAGPRRATGTSCARAVFMSRNNVNDPKSEADANETGPQRGPLYGSVSGTIGGGGPDSGGPTPRPPGPEIPDVKPENAASGRRAPDPTAATTGRDDLDRGRSDVTNH